MFNFHTHTQIKDAIINIDDKSLFPLKKRYYYSIGNHPWHNQFTINEIEKFLKNNPQIIAIGECGIDKIKQQLDVETQIEVLKKQIYLSEKFQLPVILHIVKGFNEIIKLKKEIKPKQPWIIHGFNAYKQTQALIDAEFYFSLGKALLTNNKLQHAIALIPLNRIFFETDDKDVEIEKIYTLVANLLNIKIEILIQQINKNLTSIFNGKLVRTS
ncbi:MAG TPA: hydrolase TatD [Crocinitomix sp.]|nr:hydrolase TatD [Crocinitomix sp.]